jgi:hypothetical protein
MLRLLIKQFIFIILISWASWAAKPLHLYYFVLPEDVENTIKDSNMNKDYRFSARA